ncbi:MAG: lysophospholipid acyltransferase family protein [Candidatus Omnitrophica bacterium]|nr:lysophospholipid acyltransferase family protein [Candidatus Omnitrophota bacterium]
MSKKRPYRFLLYLLLRLAQGFSLILPREWMLSFIRMIGRFTWYILPKERKKVFNHLSLAFGGAKSRTELEQIGRGVFENLGCTAVDTLRIPILKKRWSKDETLIKDDGAFERAKTALEKGKGLIFLTGHIGNWELITLYFCQKGIPGTVIARKIYYEPFNRVLEGIRLATGAQIFYRDASPKSILKVLRSNRPIGILPDQDVDSIEGVFVPFFGELAYTPSAPAKISRASGAPILPTFMVREGKGYRLIGRDLIWPEDFNSESDPIMSMTKQWSSVVESVIREYPEQWVWMHRRWKTRPKQTEEAKQGQGDHRSEESVLAKRKV